MTTQANVDALNAAAGALVAGQVTQPQVDAVNAAAANITVDAIGGTGATGSTGSSGSTGETGLPPGFTSVSVVQTDQYAPVQGTNQRWNLNLHGSGGAQLAHGDQMDIVVDETMGHVAGQVFRLAAEKKVIGTETTAQLEPADRVWLTRPGYLTNTWMETLWRGYILDNNTTSPAVPYTERRLDAAIAYARATKYPWLSATKVTASGGSMGAWGMMTYALRRPQVFAAIFASRPRWRDINYADWAVGFAKDYHGNPMADVPGQTVAQRQDHVAYVTDPANAIPFLVFALGRADGYGKFSDFTDAIAALRATGRGFACYWNAGNHSDPDIVNMTQLGSYQKAMFEIGIGYPVISRSSLDNDPAVDQVGGINLGYSWRNVQESATSWSCEISNTLGDVTAMVAPHSDVFPGAAAKSIAIPAGQWITVSFSAGQASPEQPPIDPQQPVVSAMTEIPLDYSAVVCDVTQYQTSRYERYQVALILTADTVSLKFQQTNLAAGGSTNVSFAYPRYALRVNGVERATYTRTGTERAGELTGPLGDTPDGNALFELYGVAADGTQTLLATHAGYVDRKGGGKDAPRVWVQNGSVDWEQEGSIGPVYRYASVDKAAFMTSRLKPLPGRLSPPSAAVPQPAKLTRDNLIVPCLTYGTPRKWCRTLSGVVVSENREPYFWQDATRAYPALPLIDGPRGVARSGIVLDVRLGRQGKIYGADGHACWVLDATGTRRTLFGLRHKYPPYWIEASATHPALEVVGDWDSSIPAGERFPWESWGMCWDSRSLAVDPNAPIPPGEAEDPHAGAGPVMFRSDRHDCILRAQFSATSHATPAKVTRFATASDPWGMDESPKTHEVIVAERGAHQISAIDMDTGAKRVIVSDPTAAKLGSVPDSVRMWTNAPGVTRAICRQHSIVAPEGLAVFGDYAYWASLAQAEVRRARIDGTGGVEVVARLATDGNSNYCNLVISDGTFTPAGTLFVATWSNGNFGRPLMYLPNPNVASDGVSLLYAGPSGWQQNAYGVVQGPGGKWQADSYPTAVAIGRKGTNQIIGGVNVDPDYGALVCASAGGEVAVYRTALPEDGKAPDYARAQRGFAWYKVGPAIVHGHWLDGPDLPLPYGENADGDYFMSLLAP